jgi:hypothetical protein
MKLKSPWLVKRFVPQTEPHFSAPFSQQIATLTCTHTRTHTRTHAHTYNFTTPHKTFRIHFNIIIPSALQSNQRSLEFQVHHWNRVRIFHKSCMLHVQPIIMFLSPHNWTDICRLWYKPSRPFWIVSSVNYITIVQHSDSANGWKQNCE